MPDLVRESDILIANEEDVQMALGLKTDVDVHAGRRRPAGAGIVPGDREPHARCRSGDHGHPAFERKPSSGPIRLSRRKASTSASSNARPPGILLIEKPQPSRTPGMPVQA